FDYWSNLKNDINVQHVLNMSGGWECNDWDNTSVGNEDRMYRYADWVKFILDLPMENKPGQVFSYCTGGVGLLGDVIGLGAGMDVADFAQQFLFAPLGITEFHYRTDPSGRTHVGGQMHITPLGMLKIGQLFLNGGLWDGNQIVSSQWITATKTAFVPWYKNLWWIWSDTIEAIDAEVTFYYANGNGGQRIFVVPDYELVVVFTAHEYDNPEAGYGQWLLINRIIPAMN
ncbi:serine hydrolase domain-containing protein, partial [Kaarinaea lacus]